MQHLFVYGTLRSEAQNPMSALLSTHATSLGPATYQGRMFLITGPARAFEYPGVVPSEDDSDLVRGELFSVHTDAVLERLDHYEGCGSDSPRPHEYRRELARVQRESGEEAMAYVYLFDHAVDDLKPIPGGDFLEFLGG